MDAIEKKMGHKKKKKRQFLIWHFCCLSWLLVCQGSVFTETQLRGVGAVVQWFNWRAQCSGGGREQADLT